MPAGLLIGYKYPHDYPGGWVNQQYLPDEIKDRIYYQPIERGLEKTYATLFVSKEFGVL